MFPDFFPFLKTLRLRNSNLTILPKRIEECRFLELLDLCYCKQLRQIEGLPPSTSNFLAYNCISLEAHSSTLNKLLSQAIDSTTRKFYILPGERVPEWFDYCSRGNSLRFWFRKEFPSITVCAILGVEANMQRPFHVNFNFYVKINDIEIPFLFYFNYILDTDHIFIFNDFMYPMNLDHERLVSEKEWNCGEVLFVIPSNNSGSSGSIKWTGVYVNKTCTTMKDVQFSNPYPPQNTHLSNYGTRNQVDTQQTLYKIAVSMIKEISTRNWRRPFMYPKWEQPLDSLLSNAVWELEKSKSNALWKVEKSISNSARVPYPPKSTRVSHYGTHHNVLSKSTSLKPAKKFDGSNDSNGASLDHKPKVARQSPSYIGHWSKQTHGETEERKQAQKFKVCSFAEIQNIQAQSPFPSSVVVRQGPHLGRSSPLFPTKIDPSISSQTEQTLNDDAEMDAFYAFLGAKSHVLSCSHDKSATTVLSKKARKALKRVQDFISDDALDLLHPERFGIMKTILEHLSTLSADDGMSRVMRELISEALGKVTHWSRDYIEASMKIETTASEMQRADVLEASLETNKNQFMEVVTSENELLQKLAWMEKRKETLEEEIKAIKASISTSEVEKSMIHQRKRDIFEEGKTLKTQREELMEKVPHLQQEHGLAMETLTRIKAERSELREKFKMQIDLSSISNNHTIVLDGVKLVTVINVVEEIAWSPFPLEQISYVVVEHFRKASRTWRSEFSPALEQGKSILLGWIQRFRCWSEKHD
ncbi:hypothetical protein VNO77_33340 [Canavalia gladiata]|uniref:Uncharacterized protein n=1 Tax=Canavalia gladiata TaxID=3824 RepID=A0AAN9KEQ5_CANGL